MVWAHPSSLEGPYKNHYCTNIIIQHNSVVRTCKGWGCMMNTIDSEERDLRTKFGKHMSAGLVSAVLVRGLAIILVKVLTILLPKSEYGLYSLWLALVLFASMISTSSFSASIWRFMQKRVAQDRRSASKLLSTSIIGSFIMLLCIFLAILFLQAYTGILTVVDSSYSSTLVIIVVLASFYILREIILVISGSEQNAREILSYTLAYGLPSTTIACIAAFITRDHRVVLIGLTVGYSIPILITLSIKVRQYRIAKPTRSDFKDVLVYGGPYMIISSARNSLSFIASFFVALWIGLSAVATLSVAITLSGLLQLVVGPSMLAYRAYVTNAFETGNLESGNALTTRLVEMFIVFATLIMWLIIRSSAFLINLVSTNEYLDATLLLPFTVVSVMLLSFSDFWRFRLDLAKKTHITAGIYFIGTTALVVSCLILLQPLGLIGVGVALVVYAIVILILTVLSSNLFLPIRIERQFIAFWCLSFMLLIASDIALQFIGAPILVSLVLSGLLYGIAVLSTGILKTTEIRPTIRFLVGH